MNIIETNSLTKYYGKSRGITDVNLSVPEGDFFGFIGPNGAGKSTTIRTLLGLISPSGGSAQIFGMDIVKDKEKILGQIGYMPSEPAFYHGMKVRECLRYSARLRGKDCDYEAKRLCERFALDTERKIHELSLGNRKKVSIVCALQHMPGLCILDEPTSGLDPLMQREFYSLLEERNAEGTTIFLSSHVLSEVQHHCRHAAVIREGRIMASDSIENLGNAHTKRVVIKGIHEPPEIMGIKDVKINGDSVNFLYSGTPQMLMEALSKLPITDINIAEPDLEEVFMHYYREEER
ncbi:MAG: ABC transporter ATP-binding protein [Lachnospiraceae bacterium]|nr:ABC transporter ATP-binding protein [Lachnospiraceae bacterium]